MICTRQSALNDAVDAYCAEASVVCAPDACQKQRSGAECAKVTGTLDCERHVRCEEMPPATCTGCCELGAKGDCEKRDGVGAERVPVCTTRACTPANAACATHAECCLDALGQRRCDESTRTCVGTSGVD